MTERDLPTYTDIAEGELTGPYWEAWVAAHPGSAEQIEIARRVRSLLLRLREAEIALPIGFEARLLERVQADTTLIDLLDAWFLGMGHAVIEILNLVFGLWGEWEKTPQPAVSSL